MTGSRFICGVECLQKSQGFAVMDVIVGQLGRTHAVKITRPAPARVRTKASPGQASSSRLTLGLSALARPVSRCKHLPSRLKVGTVRWGFRILRCCSVVAVAACGCRLTRFSFFSGDCATMMTSETGTDWVTRGHLQEDGVFIGISLFFSPTESTEYRMMSIVHVNGKGSPRICCTCLPYQNC